MVDDAVTASSTKNEIKSEDEKTILPKQISFSSLVGDYPTDVLLTEYDNRIFLIITQYEKLGTMLHVHIDKQQHSDQNIVYSTEIVFGKDTPEIDAAARYLAEKMNVHKPLLMSLGLKDLSIASLRTLGQVLYEELDSRQKSDHDKTISTTTV